MNYTLADLLIGARQMGLSVFGKKNEYQIEFQKEADGGWYVVFPGWPFDHHNLLMVSGADKMCELLSEDGTRTKISVIPTKKREKHEGYFELTQTESSLTGGSTYKVDLEEFKLRFGRDTLWLCPVTLFVLGQYPKYMYVKKVTNSNTVANA